MSLAAPVLPGTETARDSRRERDRAYAAGVNPQWVHLLDILGLNESYVRCSGSELHTAGGDVVLDFLSGYCVYNTGHNHPDIIAVVRDEMERHGPTMLQSHVPDLAAVLAGRLLARAGGRLEKVFFTSSGSEGVETVIKFARAHTGRSGILYAGGGFHGLTCGALSIMGDDWWREGFGPLLPDTMAVPFGDIEALRRELAVAAWLQDLMARLGIGLNIVTVQVTSLALGLDDGGRPHGAGPGAHAAVSHLRAADGVDHRSGAAVGSRRPARPGAEAWTLQCTTGDGASMRGRPSSIQPSIVSSASGR